MKKSEITPTLKETYEIGLKIHKGKAKLIEQKELMIEFMGLFRIALKGSLSDKIEMT